MIIIKYKGGLGNQMFQYAFQLAMQKKYPDQTIKADISHYKLQNEHNGFELERYFDLKLTYATEKEVRELTNLYIAPDWVLRLPAKVKQRVAGKYQFMLTALNQRLHKEKEQNYYRCRFHNSYEDVVFHLNTAHDWYMDGLWQNLNYYTDCMQDIRQAFKFHEDVLTEEDRRVLKEIKEKNSVSVHVRRGDFVNSKFDICDRQYYNRAMKLMNEKVKDIQYYFFSDDAEFIYQEFADIQNKKVIVHDIYSSIVDMYMMNSCMNHIISNSTFSYWAAFLNAEKEKIVIAPAYSIRNTIGEYELSAPNEWNLIEV